jgi:hypothetical protein
MSSRKYPSGSKKRKRKKHADDFIETQRGAIDKFLKINPNVSTNPNNELAIVAVEELAIVSTNKMLEEIFSMLSCNK